MNEFFGSQVVRQGFRPHVTLVMTSKTKTNARGLITFIEIKNRQHHNKIYYPNTIILNINFMKRNILKHNNYINIVINNIELNCIS